MAVGHTYKDVYADWLEPTIHSSACSPTAESTWVGLGGYHVETLAQAGTAVGEGGLGVGAHQAWYELIHQKINKFMPIPVHATVGGEFTAEVDRTAHGYYIFLKNDFTGKAKDYTPSFRYYVGQRLRRSSRIHSAVSPTEAHSLPILRASKSKTRRHPRTALSITASGTSSTTTSS